jgi:hypothetical protein
LISECAAWLCKQLFAIRIPLTGESVMRYGGNYRPIHSF